MSAKSPIEGLNPDQLDAVVHAGGPLLVIAGAGSGKTRVLTHRIAWQSVTGAIAPGRVLALTFTRKAAGELRDRLARLGVAEGVAAGTFHSMALAQLRRHHADRPHDGDQHGQQRQRGNRLQYAHHREDRLLDPPSCGSQTQWHTKQYRNLRKMKEAMQAERVAAFQEFIADVRSGTFPGPEHIVKAPSGLIDAFLGKLDPDK